MHTSKSALPGKADVDMRTFESAVYRTDRIFARGMARWKAGRAFSRVVPVPHRVRRVCEFRSDGFRGWGVLFASVSRAVCRRSRGAVHAGCGSPVPPDRTVGLLADSGVRRGRSRCHWEVCDGLSGMSLKSLSVSRPFWPFPDRRDRGAAGNRSDASICGPPMVDEFISGSVLLCWLMSCLKKLSNFLPDV